MKKLLMLTCLVPAFLLTACVDPHDHQRDRDRDRFQNHAPDRNPVPPNNRTPYRR